jgi:hypothetical protein
MAGGIGLTLTDARGGTLTFAGKELAEPAHYTTTVTVPRDGRWRVSGVQGVFAPHEVGTLTVPGSLETIPLEVVPSAEDIAKYWPGPVRPPVPAAKGAPDTAAGQAAAAVDQPVAQAPQADASPAAAGSADSAVPVPPGVATTTAMVLGGLLLLAALGVAMRRTRLRTARSTGADGSR